MRFGHLRGVMFAVALIGSLAGARLATADGFHYTIPREVLARDLATGQPYFAPPIPWGCYAKDGIGDHYFGKHCGICGLLLGKGAGLCGGHGLLGKGGGKHCGKDGCGHCGQGMGGGGGLFHHNAGDSCGDPGCGFFGGHGRRVKDCGLCKGKGCGLCRSSEVGDPIHTLASEQTPAPARAVATSAQSAPIVSSQACVEPGCRLGKGHKHGGSMMNGDPCGSCGGKGCGLCGGLGRLFGGHGGQGDYGGQGGVGETCGSCGGKGCGLCGGLGKLFGGHGGKCGACGGKGCHLCSSIKGKLFGLLHPHKGNIKYFVGPGGPVPLTPGYVPYVVTTRSPRDFLAFPPYTPDGF